MQLKCEQCGAPFRAADLKLERGIAVCSACGSVQRFPGPDVAEARDDVGLSSSKKRQGDVPVPPRFTIEDNGNELVISRSWFQYSLFFLLFFAIAWDSFLVFWYSMALGGNGPPGPGAWLFVVFPIAHVAVGVGLTYFVLAGFLNSTLIRVTDGVLSVRHGPLPWLGNLDLQTEGIHQIYCQDKLTEHRNHGGARTSLSYEVHAVVGDRKVKLLSELQEADHALFVEQRLERFLGIEDRPVPGEMPAP